MIVLALSISCLYLNARHVINKRDELELYITENEPSLIGIRESWANYEIEDNELNLENTKCFQMIMITKMKKGKIKRQCCYALCKT